MAIALIFPGQGSQSAGMGKSFYDNFPYCKDIFLEADDALGVRLSQIMFDGGPELSLTQYTQPAILTVSFAAFEVLRKEAAINAAFTAGHSLGEYSALLSQGAFSFSDAVKLVYLRGKIMQDAVPEGEGLMAAVIGLEPNLLEEICKGISDGEGFVGCANYNGGGQIVISGNTGKVKLAMEKTKEAGAKRVIPLNVSIPSHSMLMKEASKKLSEAIETIDLKNFCNVVMSNVTALPHTFETVKERLVEQMYLPVKWEHSIKYLRDNGVQTFVEVGPGKVLSGLNKRIVEDSSTFNVEDIESLKKTMENMNC